MRERGKKNKTAVSEIVIVVFPIHRVSRLDKRSKQTPKTYQGQHRPINHSYRYQIRVSLVPGEEKIKTKEKKKAEYEIEHSFVNPCYSRRSILALLCGSGGGVMVYLSYVPSHPIGRNNRGAGIRSGHRRESSRRGPSYSRSQQNDANVSVGTKSPPRTRYAPSRGTRPV